MPPVDASLPPTLDLRDPTRRGLGWLKSTDPQELAATPGQGWWHGWGYGDVTGRMVEAFALARRMLNQTDVGPEEERARQSLLSLFDSPDGLSWRPETPFRRRAAHMFDQSSVFFGLVAWWEESRDPAVAAHLDRLVEGLSTIAEWHQAWCRYPLEVYTPSGWRVDHDEFRDHRQNVPADPCHEGGRQIMPLVRFYEMSGHEGARRLAEGLTRYIIRHSGVFEPDGSFLERQARAAGHVHSRLATAAGILRLGQVTGNAEWMDWARTVFCWALSHVASSFGWVSERAHNSIGGCETCAITDALDLAITLAQNGHPEYWDVAEAFARNHLLESQCPQTGGFSGHTMPGDFCWIHHTTGQPEHHVGGCCSPAGLRGLWVVWDRITTFRDGDVFVHFPLTREAPWASIVSYLPWAGQVEVTVKRACNLMMRMPAWAARHSVRLAVNGQNRPLTWVDDYVSIAELAPGDLVIASYPLRQEQLTERFMGFCLNVTWRGNTVMGLEPQGEFEPLYQRH